MGLTALVSSSASASSASSLSLSSAVGTGVGGVFVVIALVVLLAYLDVFNASQIENKRVQTALYSAVLPLFITFVGIVAFQTSQLL